MRSSALRKIAYGLCGFLSIVLPERRRGWADGLRSEIAEIADDREALSFALSGYCGLMTHAVLARLHAAFLAITTREHSRGGAHAMQSSSDQYRQPRLLGVISAIAAVCLGLAYMAAAGAPATYIGVNLGALALGIGFLAVAVRLSPMAGRWSGFEILAIAVVLLATALFGRSVEGAARWFALGPFFLQTSLIVLPLMIIRFARNQNPIATAGMCLAALALALQPDRAMAGVLLAGLGTLSLFRFDRFVGAALACAAIAFVVTLQRPDTLPAVPFVDRILWSALDIHPLAGAAVWIGAAVLLVPVIVGLSAQPDMRASIFVFGAVWLAVILSAALGNYPTPVVGYGASAIIGYLLCLSALPKSVAAGLPTKIGRTEARDRDRPSGFQRARTFAVIGLLIFGTSHAAGQETVDECGRKKVDKVERPNVAWQPGASGRQVLLWPKGHTLGAQHPPETPEMVGSGSDLIAGRTWNFATFVSRPTMTVYPPEGQNTRTALLVLPGGGYAAVAMDLEGTEICDWITQQGVTCIVLKYRTPQVWRRGDNGVQVPPEHLFSLEDAQRAMGLLRTQAASYEIDPDKIGVIGFSAGAHLAAAVSNEEKRTYSRIDAADDRPSQPNFAIVLYPGRFLSERRPKADLTLAPWMKITASAPPTLLIHAMNDPSNDVRHSMAYGLALSNVGVPVDMRFFAKGCHAFGLRPTSAPVTTEWPALALQWLRNIKML
jgi:acetyl esterase/lipase/cell division protein FtsW (lipid II flippase)